MATAKKSNTLGQILKTQGYTALLERIEILDAKEFKNLTHTDSEKPISQLDLLLFNVPDLYYVKDDEGKNTKLSETGVFEFINWAVKNGASPNSTIKYGNSAFLKSAGLPEESLLKYFVENIPEINITQKDGRGADILMHSVASQSLEVFDYVNSLQEFDINKQYTLLNNKTILHVACALGEKPMIDKILDAGGDLTIMDNTGSIPADMIPTKTESPLSEEETTPDKIEQWEQLFTNLAELSKKAVKDKKSVKNYKTSF